MDRFSRGFLAGVVGGVAMNIWSFIAYYVLNLPIIRFLDWSSIILFGDLPSTLWQGNYALMIQIIWSGFLGILLSLVFPHMGSKNYLIKGALFGLIIGFVIYAFPVLFKMPYLYKSKLETVISNHIGGIIWGLVTAQTLKWLDRKVIKN